MPAAGDAGPVARRDQFGDEAAAPGGGDEPATTTVPRMPFAQWPGMWQPRRSFETSAAAAGTVQMTSTRWPDGTTTRMPDTSGGTLTTGVGPGGGIDRRELRGLPGVLDGLVADDQLVDLEPAVDDVEEDGLAGDDVDRIGQEDPVLQDDVDLARRDRRPGHDRRGRRRGAGVAGGSEHRDGGDGGQDGGPTGEPAGFERGARRESRARPPSPLRATSPRSS